MWKGPIIAMDTLYPFGAVADPNAPKHLVRKKISKNEKYLEKAQLIVSLKHECLIKLQSACEEGGENYVLFQYIPTSLQKWYSTVSHEFIENYEQRLILFSRYIADKSIIITFRRENMGVSSIGDAKYYLDFNFEINSGVDKLALKKKYKEEIKQLMEYYLEKKNNIKTPITNKPQQVSEKKENSKILKILQAIEKGKANLRLDTNKEQPKDQVKETSHALVPQSNAVVENKATLKPIKNIQNVTIQRQINKVNKIQVMVNNKPVQVLQQEFKKEFASSSLYINGVPTLVLEREGQARRLLSPNQKLSRFEEVKYKEYKSMKTSGEHYVQDFINVLQADDAEKMTLPGSPRTTLTPSTKMIVLSSPRNNLFSPKNTMVQRNSTQFAIEQEKQQPQKRQYQQKKIAFQEQRKNFAPKQVKPSNERMIPTEKQIQRPNEGNHSKTLNSISQHKTTPSNLNKTNELQKKVSQAIANSLSAISKFKNAKNHLNP